jgi:hypothetical protein
MENTKEPSLYRMQLHTRFNISEGLYVMRVPGGWMYVMNFNTTIKTSTFVPLDYEFDE